MRASRSKSGFTKDQRQFVLVYKQDNGKFGDSLTFSRDEVLAIARGFEDRQSGIEEKGVTKNAAKLIHRMCRENGLLGQESARTEGGQQESSLVGVKAEPEYFPKLKSKQAFSDDVVVDVAFLLSGVDPGVRMRTNTPLRQLARGQSGRVPASVHLLGDHRYLLPQFHGQSLDAFHRSWDAATSRLNQQLTSDTWQLVQNLHEFDERTLAATQVDAATEKLLATFKERSIDLLAGLFQRAQLKISSVHAQPVKEETANWPSLLGKWFRRRPEAPQETVDPEARDVAKEYLTRSFKLARLIRWKASGKDQ